MYVELYRGNRKPRINRQKRVPLRRNLFDFKERSICARTKRMSIIALKNKSTMTKMKAKTSSPLEA
jgi:hypothetical protein